MQQVIGLKPLMWDSKVNGYIYHIIYSVTKNTCSDKYKCNTIYMYL